MRRRSALRHRYGRAASSGSALKAAVRKIERMIADVEAGRTETSSDDANVFRAINKLEDRVYQDWRKTDDVGAREEGYAIVQSLKTRMRAAVVIGFEARQSRRSNEIRGIREKELERREKLSPEQRQYEDELKRMRR